MITRAAVFAAMLIALLILDLFLFPLIIKNGGIIAPAGSDYNFSPQNFQAIPFSLSTVSDIASAFASNQPIEAFIFNTTQFQNIGYGGYYGEDFEFASGNVYSDVINATLSTGEHFLLFNNYGIQAQASVTITDSITIVPSQDFPNPSSPETLVSPGSSYSLAPGQYLSIGFNLTGSSILRGSYSLAARNNTIWQNYVDFETPAYIMTANQLASYLANKSAMGVRGNCRYVSKWDLFSTFSRRILLCPS
ncbi:MAG: hypothetical protein ACYC7D_15955 [Nitrososphaerales archaeon]